MRWLAELLLRKPLRRAWAGLRAPLHLHITDEIASLREDLAAARRIAADTHLALTGREHPDAPPKGA